MSKLLKQYCPNIYSIYGVCQSLKQDIEKHSATLDRTAQYQKISKVSRLPKYLVVHFIRFFWKPSERVRAKILRKVKFPLDWDATELCTEELQNKYGKVKAKLREVEDSKLEQERETKKRKMKEETEDDSADKETPKESASTSMDTDPKQESVDWTQYVDESLASDVGANVTGQYELCSVLTHVGRSADSGKNIIIISSWINGFENLNNVSCRALYQLGQERI
jgi:ubiquitin carboxyl-terminal hydrolase 14